MKKLVPATTRPTATWLENPTRAKSGGVVHQTIKPKNLRDNPETKINNQRLEVRANGMEFLDQVPGTLSFGGILCFFDGSFDKADLCIGLF